MKAMHISAAGLKAQGQRMRVIAENLANTNSLAKSPGADPYRRKMMSFRNVLDRVLGIQKVEVDRMMVDKTDFAIRFEPGHPAADASGYVKLPNVNPLIEMADMRESQRSFEANLTSIEVSKSMMSRLLDLLR
jgi:flagellar basal-body rod protein FlgC